MAEATNESTLTKIQNFQFPTILKDCYQIETIPKNKQSYLIDIENSTSPLYQLLDHILLDKYANFHGGVQVASVPTEFNDDCNRHLKEEWKDISTQASVSNQYTKEGEEEKKLNAKCREFIVSQLECILSPDQFSICLGCVNNRRFAFLKADGSIRFDYRARSNSEEDVRKTDEQYYVDSVKTFIELILKAIEEDNEQGEFSIHMAANLSADARDTERDEFLAIVTPNNNTIIIMGFFYYDYYD